MPRELGKYRVALSVLLVLTAVFSSNAVSQEREILEVRASVPTKKFSGAYQIAAAFHLSPPRWLHANRLELAVGAIAGQGDTRAWASIGPVWRWEGFTGRPNLYLELGFSPTVLGGSTFGSRDLGSDFHFTSSLAVGRRFSSLRNSALTLRIQHISNGGLNSTNPGMDMIGISYV